MKDYKTAIDIFCNDNPGLTVFQVGEISHPGISDLDLLVIGEEPKISKSVKEMLVGGSVIIMPKSLFSKIYICSSHLQDPTFS